MAGGKRGRVDAGDFHNFKDSRVKFSLPVFLSVKIPFLNNLVLAETLLPCQIFNLGSAPVKIPLSRKPTESIFPTLFFVP